MRGEREYEFVALRPVISHVLPLAAAAKAHRILEGRLAGGKIVLDVTTSSASQDRSEPSK